MTSSSKNDRDRRKKRGKVARLIEEYGLEGFGEDLERAWTADTAQRQSLRTLADQFNRELLRKRLTETGKQPTGGEVEALYEGISGKGVSSGDQTRLRRRLRRQNIDPEQLQNDFVSYQAIRTYLTKHREATYDPPETDRFDETRDTANQLRTKLTTVVSSRLDRLTATDELETGTLTVTADIRVTCEQCGDQLTLDELLERRECNCSYHE